MRRSMISHECREVYDVFSPKYVSDINRDFSPKKIGAENSCKTKYDFDRFDVSDEQVVAYFNCEAEGFTLKYSITYMSKPDEDDRITLCRYSITPK